MGAEYWYNDQFALRAGYLANSEDQGFTAGAGVKVSVLELDYAFQPYSALGSVHRFSGMLKWNGPWMGGVEPAAPRYVQARSVEGGIEIDWDKPEGLIQGFAVEIQTLDGRQVVLVKSTRGTNYLFKEAVPGVAYKVMVSSIGEGGTRSASSREAYFAGGTGPISTPVLAVVTGQLDGLGLRLSWPVPEGNPVAGYNIYRKNPSGEIQKVTTVPKRSNQVWVTDVAGMSGWEWTVTALEAEGTKEKNVGSYVWRSTVEEEANLAKAPSLALAAAVKEDHQVQLNWDAQPQSSGYSVFYSMGGDGVYELLSEVKDKTRSNILLKLVKHDQAYKFVVAPQGENGALISRTKDAEVPAAQ
jgi:hypothetical protein